MMRRLIALAILIALSVCAALAQDTTAAAGMDSSALASQQKDEIAAAYAIKCAGCHTIGGGKLTGPDLLPARVWPPSELFAKVKLMEQRVGPLTDAEVNSFVSLLQDARAGERVKIAQELAQKAVAATLEPASLGEGRRLFSGEKPLANGGLACITCHRAGARGGTMGPNLTLLRDRMGKVAMTSAIQQAQYPVMSGAYKDSPITAQEAVHLAEFLSSPELQPAGGAEDHVSVAGVIIGVVALLGIVSLYRRNPDRAVARTRGNA